MVRKQIQYTIPIFSIISIAQYNITNIQANVKNNENFSLDTLIQKYKKKLQEKKFNILCTTSSVVSHSTPPIREDTLVKLQNDTFDILIVGGGVVGAGICLEAVKRGLKVALIDRHDFASGTSSNSTKLIHGGVRYLEQAIYTLDIQMLKLVAQALKERGHMLRSASYMNHTLPIIIPLYHYWEIPYMWIGCKLYDLIALTDGTVPSSYYISSKDIQYKFPSLRQDNIVGGIVYFDGQMNDSRHTLTLLLTAQLCGATIINYVNLDNFEKEKDNDIINKKFPTEIISTNTICTEPITSNCICNAIVTDTLSKKQYKINAKSIINATGIYSDIIRKMDNKNSIDLVIPSGGVHISLKPELFPKDIGLLIPKTSDKRVLFCLPWENGIISGTTDTLYTIEDFPKANIDDIKLIIDNLNQYIKDPITIDDITSVWCGVRPLVRNPKYAHLNTSKVSRDHMIISSKSGLITVLGGKYTTYRLMAQETIDTLLNLFGIKYFANLTNPISKTINEPILGMDIDNKFINGNFDNLYILLKDVYNLQNNTIEHLIRTYGIRALEVADYSMRWSLSITKKQQEVLDTLQEYNYSNNKQDISSEYLSILSNAFNTNIIDNKNVSYNHRQLLKKYPYLEAEIFFSMEKEQAIHADDILFRRLRLGFININDTLRVAKKTIALMNAYASISTATAKDEMENIFRTVNRMSIKEIYKVI